MLAKIESTYSVPHSRPAKSATDKAIDFHNTERMSGEVMSFRALTVAVNILLELGSPACFCKGLGLGALV